MIQLHKPAAPTILVVDDDLGFMVWLGETLSEAGYLSVPAVSGQQAERVLRDLHLNVKLVIVNFNLPGVIQLIETLRRRDASLKLIAIQEPAANMRSPVINVDAAHIRSQVGWVALVRRILGRRRAATAH